MKHTAVLTFLYTNIGRGHPYYLDGIAEALIRSGDVSLVRSETDVFEQSGFVSSLGWKLARYLYYTGSSPGMVNKVYAKIRSNNNYNKLGMMLNLMGRSLRKKWSNQDSPLLVAHPSLVAVLRGRKNIIYQHGELIVPSEALVEGAAYVLVPTDSAAQPFRDFGYNSSQVIVTGICIEPALVKQADDAYTSRQKRFNSDERLVGAYYSSGAEPSDHVDLLCRSACSAVQNQGRAIIFAIAGGRFDTEAVRAFTEHSIIYKRFDSAGPLPHDLPPASIMLSRTRREETNVTARLFSQFDYFVAPSHERTNWAVGLGLPMFNVGPQVGPFAPLNRELLLKLGVAQLIDQPESAKKFGPDLNRARRGEVLKEMSKAAYKKYDVNGFSNIAEFLVNLFGINP